jgi:hypothetical protein
MQIEIDRVCTQRELVEAVSQCELLAGNLAWLDQVVMDHGLGRIDRPGAYVQALSDTAIWCNKLASSILRDLERHHATKA